MSEVQLKVLIEIAHSYEKNFFLTNLLKIAPTKCINIPLSQSKELNIFMRSLDSSSMSTYT